jgi:hypothetical protein
MRTMPALSILSLVVVGCSAGHPAGQPQPDASASGAADTVAVQCAGRPPGLAPPGTLLTSAQDAQSYCGQCNMIGADEHDLDAGCVRHVILGCVGGGRPGDSGDMRCFKSPVDGRVVGTSSSLGFSVGGLVLDTNPSDCAGLPGAAISAPPCP